MQSPSGNLNLIFFQQLCKILPIMQPWIFFFRVFLNSNHKISRHKSSRKFPPHLTVVLIEFRSEIYDLKNTLRRRDTNQRPSTTKVQFSTMLHSMGSNQLWNSNFTDYFFLPLFEIQGRKNTSKSVAKAFYSNSCVIFSLRCQIIMLTSLKLYMDLLGKIYVYRILSKTMVQMAIWIAY